MDRVHALFLGQRDDAVNIQVRFHRPFSFADQVGFVRFEAMQRQPVFLRVDRDRAETQFSGGPQNADGDFAAIES